MFDHVGLRVADLDKTSSFYDALLKSLGMSSCYSDADQIGYGRHGSSVFWLYSHAFGGAGAHIAFAALDRASVKAFHTAGLAAGGKDNGAPGLRPDYGANYFAAFLIDRDGNNVEAVCHGVDD